MYIHLYVYIHMYAYKYACIYVYTIRTCSTMLLTNASPPQ